MLKRIAINLVCFLYNWYWITKIRYRNYVVTQRIKYTMQIKNRCK